MIAKHVPMCSLKKSDFAGLMNYITDPQSKEHRLEAVQVTNCESSQLNGAIAEVMAMQQFNRRLAGMGDIQKHALYIGNNLTGTYAGLGRLTANRWRW